MIAEESPGKEHLRCAQFLHLPVRVFIAASGAFDPLVEEASASSLNYEESMIPSFKEYKEARVAVDQPNWESRGISGFGDYLKHLFEDHGGDLYHIENGVAETDPKADFNSNSATKNSSQTSDEAASSDTCAKCLEKTILTWRKDSSGRPLCDTCGAQLDIEAAEEQTRNVKGKRIRLSFKDNNGIIIDGADEMAVSTHHETS
ncbi:uncharacterized protein PAC_05038 [Phialocephala subalpina]|uniref:GATA-type domain-containing protein n=1 Tax=Phialocephala subalpina TaxID=576137 RepID=A0A1L7WQX1_9HELO|nr:uncharacterized protein PAC_05038 [Phialocephala subalpina]